MSPPPKDSPPMMSGLEIANLMAIQQKLSTIDPQLRTPCDPKIHTSLNPEIMWVRDELKVGRDELVAVRKARLKQLLLNEVIEQERVMRKRGYAYIPTQP